MSENSKERIVARVGIDLAKNSFHVHGVDAVGQTVFGKKLNRAKFSPFVANLAACTVATEACGGANDRARRFRTFGHEVRLIAPQLVKPYVKTNKNDARDAEAIAEAAQRSGLRFVAVKRVEQQRVMRTGRRKNFIRARGSATTPHRMPDIWLQRFLLSKTAVSLLHRGVDPLWTSESEVRRALRRRWRTALRLSSLRCACH